MSFPKLILSGNVANREITGIGVLYQNDSSGEAKPAYINRLNYTVRRVYSKQNIAGGPGVIKTDVPYDRVRLVHNWIGYIDVLTQSVVLSNTSSAQEIDNVQLLRSAVYLNDSEISFAYKRFTNTDLGIGNLSDGTEYSRGDDSALSWTAKINAGTPQTVNSWVIKETSIKDNLNNTSRVTFNLEIVQGFLDLPSILGL